MYFVHKTRAKDVTPVSKSIVHVVLYMLSKALQTSISVATRKISCHVDGSVLAVDLDVEAFWVGMLHHAGEQRTARRQQVIHV